MALDETISAGQAGHITDSEEVHRKVNFLTLEDSGSVVVSPTIVLGADGNAVASDIGSVFITGGADVVHNNIVGGDGSVTVNDFSNANVASTGTGADYSAIPAGIDNVVGGQASIVSGSHNYSALATTHATIGGGSVQVVSGNYGTVSGGNANTVSGDYGMISGGRDNTASGDYGTIAGGESNTASGLYTSVLGGTANTVNGDYSTVLGGRDCEVTGDYASAVGYHARAPFENQHTIGILSFTAAGDAQISTVLMKHRSTNALEDFVDSLAIPTDTTWFFTYSIVARREDADNESAAYTIVGCIDNNAGTTAFVGSPTTTIIAEDSATWDTRAVASNGTDSLQWYVTGEAAKDIRWVAKIDLVEVTG